MSSVHLNSVIRLIYRKGNDDLSLRRVSQTTDPFDPTNTIDVVTTDNMMSYQGRYSSSDISGGVIEQGDIKLYVDPSTLSIIPQNTDKVTDGTTIWNIKNIDKYTEQDTVCLYILQLRE